MGFQNLIRSLLDKGEEKLFFFCSRYCRPRVHYFPSRVFHIWKSWITSFMIRFRWGLEVSWNYKWYREQLSWWVYSRILYTHWIPSSPCSSPEEFPNPKLMMPSVIRSLNIFNLNMQPWEPPKWDHTAAWKEVHHFVSCCFLNTNLSLPSF